MFDAVSVDEYAGTLNKSGQPRTKSTCPHPTLEAKCVFDFMRENVYPRLKPHQRVFVVPGTYGLTASDGGETDRMLKAKLELYWELAVKDPLVIGMKPWHFANEHAVPANATDAVWINQFHLGATSYPSLMASLRTKGAAVKAKHGPNSWVAAQAWLPTPSGGGFKTDDVVLEPPQLLLATQTHVPCLGRRAADALPRPEHAGTLAPWYM